MLDESTNKLLVRGELKLTKPQKLADAKIVAGPDLTDGRGLTIVASGIDVRNCMVQSNGDDGACIWGPVSGITIRDCVFMGVHQWPDASDYSRVNKCFVAGDDPENPDPSHPNWFTVRDCRFGGGFRAPCIRGGTFEFRDCWFGPSRRNVLTRPRGNFVNCEFVVQVGMKTAGGPNNWSDSADVFVRPLCVEEPLPDSLRFSGCKLTVLGPDGVAISSRPATGSELCRLLDPKAETLVGSNVDVPATTFRKTLNPRS